MLNGQVPHPCCGISQLWRSPLRSEGSREHTWLPSPRCASSGKRRPHSIWLRKPAGTGLGVGAGGTGEGWLSDATKGLVGATAPCRVRPTPSWQKQAGAGCELSIHLVLPRPRFAQLTR